MIYTQPVFYEFGDLRMPVLLVIGDKDTTAFGKDAARLSEARKGSRQPDSARAPDRIPRSRTFAASSSA
jgi:hypothetical protein